jgi:hypothetical protein
MDLYGHTQSLVPRSVDGRYLGRNPSIPHPTSKNPRRIAVRRLGEPLHRNPTFGACDLTSPGIISGRLVFLRSIHFVGTLVWIDTSDPSKGT